MDNRKRKPNVLTHIEKTDLVNPRPTKRSSASKFSSWYLTIVPNLPFHDKNDPNIELFGDTLAEVLDELFNDADELQSVLKFNTRVRNRELTNVVSHFGIERGPENHLIHAHGLVTIEHKTNLQLGYDKMKAWVFRELVRSCKKYRLPVPNGLYFNADYLPDQSKSLTTKKAIMDYIEKNKKQIEQCPSASYVGKDKNKQYEYQRDEKLEEISDKHNKEFDRMFGQPSEEGTKKDIPRDMVEEEEEEDEEFSGSGESEPSDGEDLAAYEEEGEEPEVTQKRVPHVQWKLPKLKSI
jgi:hypothetical protein